MPVSEEQIEKAIGYLGEKVTRDVGSWCLISKEEIITGDESSPCYYHFNTDVIRERYVGSNTFVKIGTSARECDAGRRLFLETHYLDPKVSPWKKILPWVTVRWSSNQPIGFFVVDGALMAEGTIQERALLMNFLTAARFIFEHPNSYILAKALIDQGASFRKAVKFSRGWYPGYARFTPEQLKPDSLLQYTGARDHVNCGWHFFLIGGKCGRWYYGDDPALDRPVFHNRFDQALWSYTGEGDTEDFNRELGRLTAKAPVKVGAFGLPKVETNGSGDGPWTIKQWAEFLK